MPAKKAKTQIPMELHRNQFLKRVEELWRKHQKEIAAILENSEDDKIPITFKASINAAESAQKLKTRIAWSENFSDERDDTMDPNQGEFTLAEDPPAHDGEDKEGEVPYESRDPKPN